uniref:Uncharacterized protein n=1 Tax=Fagus sylvatica TaxID=28930 RepID=A0A2N9IBZ6_FAGSY
MAKPGSSPAPLITTADGGGFWLGLASLSSRGYCKEAMGFSDLLVGVYGYGRG